MPFQKGLISVSYLFVSYYYSLLSLIIISILFTLLRPEEK